MNKRNLGSKQAELLARKKFGPKAYAMRSDKVFEIGTLAGGFVRLSKGRGKSWAEALENAVIRIPTAESYFPPVPTTIPDTDPMDTDAPVTMPEEV
jgi:hypothetical protein